MPRHAAAKGRATVQAASEPAAEQAAERDQEQQLQARQWRKVLYAQQPFGDSHTPESFLEELVVNATVPHRDYGTVVWSTLVVDQQLSTVAVVGSASYHLYQGTITPRRMLLADVLLALLGTLLYFVSSAWSHVAGRATIQPAGAPGSPIAAPHGTADMWHNSSSSPSPPSSASKHRRAPSFSGSRSSSSRSSLSAPSWPLTWHSLLDGAGSMAALATATALLSPLLGTLTETVSSDSIIACACLLLLAHLYLHDYHFTAGLTAHVSGSLALGCAVCSSVLIASRLGGDPEAVYAQLLLSLELYILGPYCRRQVAAATPAAHLLLTLGMAWAAAGLLALQSVLLTSTFCCCIVFVTLICPMWLVRIQKYKAQINGPWDEAVPHLSRHLPQ